MEVKNKYGKSQVVVLNVGQDDLDGMLINWDLTDNGRYDYMEKEFVDSVMGYLPEYKWDTMLEIYLLQTWLSKCEKRQKALFK